VRISVKVDYACRVMAELARLHGSGELAQILGELREHGLITSRRGSQGGYTLARPPEEISLYDILVAVEGRCLHLSGNHRGRSGRRLKQVWDEIGRSLVEKTKGYTLNQLVSKTPAEMYYI
jgi:Rrf2 family transcriptional regulator, cysteine metabolism repressor